MNVSTVHFETHEHARWSCTASFHWVQSCVESVSWNNMYHTTFYAAEEDTWTQRDREQHMSSVKAGKVSGREVSGVVSGRVWFFYL